MSDLPQRSSVLQLATLLGAISEELSWADIGVLALLPGSSRQPLHWDDLRELSIVLALTYRDAKGVFGSVCRRRYWVQSLKFYRKSSFERGDGSSDTSSFHYAGTT